MQRQRIQQNQRQCAGASNQMSNREDLTDKDEQEHRRKKQKCMCPNGAPRSFFEEMRVKMQRELDKKHSKLEAKLRENIEQELTSKLKEKFQCVLCLNCLHLPVKICRTGHYACFTCFRKWTDQERFKLMHDDVCGTTVVTATDEHVLLRCPTQCDQLTSYHVMVCQIPDYLLYKLADEGHTRQCSYTACEFRAAGRQMVEHMLSCPFETTSCLCCSKAVVASAYNHHLQFQCDRLQCHKCENEEDQDPIYYTHGTLCQHLKAHQLTTIRHSLHHYQQEILRMLGTEGNPGSVHLPTSSDQRVPSHTFRDLIALGVAMRSFVDGIRHMPGVPRLGTNAVLVNMQNRLGEPHSSIDYNVIN